MAFRGVPLLSSPSRLFCVLCFNKVLSKNARFEQIWRSRKGKKEVMRDDALHEMCHVYDVVRVDVEEATIEVHDQE